MRGRFAPSPTGLLHLGNLRSALLGWLHARSQGGEFWLRIEDLDKDRCRPQFTDAIFRDLEFLGLDWNGPVLKQSERGEVYDRALEQLRDAGQVYECFCSRAEIARAASAPHAGEEGPVYPGTCFHASGRGARPPSWRFHVEPGSVEFVDLFAGPQTQDVAREVGDFVVRRADGIASYQLAVVVDDAESKVTDVLRGDDLLVSTPRQVLLYRALGRPVPRFAHLPLLVQEDGARLSKRVGSTTLTGLRALGFSAERVVGLLAKWSGLGDGSAVKVKELVEAFSLARVSRGAATVRAAELS